STPCENTRSTVCRLPSTHSYGCSFHLSAMPAMRCLPVVALDGTPVFTDSISNFTGARPTARFIFSVFETYGHSACGDDCSSHSNEYVCTALARTIGG